MHMHMERTSASWPLAATPEGVRVSQGVLGQRSQANPGGLPALSVVRVAGHVQATFDFVLNALQTRIGRLRFLTNL